MMGAWIQKSTTTALSIRETTASNKYLLVFPFVHPASSAQSARCSISRKKLYRQHSTGGYDSIHPTHTLVSPRDLYHYCPFPPCCVLRPSHTVTTRLLNAVQIVVFGREVTSLTAKKTKKLEIYDTYGGKPQTPPPQTGSHGAKTGGWLGGWVAGWLDVSSPNQPLLNISGKGGFHH